MSDSKATGLPAQPRVVRRGEAPSYSISGTDRYDFLFSGHPQQPEMFDSIGTRGDSTPLHRHPWATWELIIEGTVRFMIGEEVYTLGPGDFVYTPPDTPHSFVVESETARMVGFNHPAGAFEALQQKAGPLFQREGGPDLEAIAKLAAEHGVELLGPPLEPASD